MVTQKWKKAPAEHIVAFDAALPKHPKVERRTMFGYACAFVNGNMFAGLHEENICVRIDQQAATDCIEEGKARTFAPMAGRVMKEYVAVPKADCIEIERLKGWIEEAFRHSLTLPSKTKKPKAARAPAAAKKPRTSANG